MNSPTPSLSQAAIREFLIETQESLEQVETDLVALERKPGAANASSAGIGRMFRMLHSIKGACGFLGYPKLEELAHVGESLLGRIREGILPVDSTVITALLSVVDAIREVLQHIAAKNEEGDHDYSNLTQYLSQILDSDECSAPAAAPDFFATPDPDPDEASLNPPAIDSSSPEDGGRRHSSADEEERVASRLDRAVLSQSDSIAGSLNDHSSPGKSDIDLISSRSGNASRPSQSRRDKRQPDANVADSILRIDVALLDKMMILAGELVLTRNQILQDKSLESAVESEGRLHGVYRQLNAITSELQGCIMKSRMQPISTIWRQMPRMVRDVSLAAFKQVRLEMEGEDTELDKTLIEAIRDPLTHVLRNAVDHGIELPELRVALGKPAEGRIWMRAYHAGGQINIEIGDDGAGIDRRVIRRKAIEQNLVAPSQVNEMSDLALLNLLFQPGFSTTERVTKLSGRGVGLDVVKSNVEKLGGAIHVQSTLGAGATFTLRIPLTLAIVQALIVKAAGDRYVVPQSRIVELIRLRGDEANAALDATSGAPVFRFRGRLLPVVHLRHLLELPTGECESASQVVHLVVLSVHDRRFGLVVDQIVDHQEVVIKPLWRPLRQITTYAGATQLADGAVALILDPVGLAKRAGLVLQRRETEPGHVAGEPAPDRGQRILVARLDHGGRIALSTSGLTRIIKLTRSRIEKLHGQEMMEYDGRIVRVLDVASLMGHGSPSIGEADTNSIDSNTTHVALYALHGETVGLIVGPVVDVLQRSLDVRGKSTGPHVQFTTMIDEKLVEYLDVEGLIASLEAHRVGDESVAFEGG